MMILKISQGKNCYICLIDNMIGLNKNNKVCNKFIIVVNNMEQGLYQNENFATSPYLFLFHNILSRAGHTKFEFLSK